MPKVVAVSCVVAFLLAACDGGSSPPDEEPLSSSTSVATVAPTASAATSSTAVASPTLVWASCGQAECATLTVPRDHDNPSLGSLDLMVARRAAGRPDRRIGVLLFNPGGPGLAGTPRLVAGADQFSPELRDRFDLVSWDPRGVSEGARVDCVDEPDFFRGLDPTPDTAEEAAALEDRARAFVAGCAERSSDLLPFVSTVATARDMDLLRRALGEEEVSFLGVGYGAALGAVYATMFPQRVRAMVLDGGYDPSAAPEESAVQAAAARERALTAVLDGCAADSLCYFFNSGDPYTAFDQLMVRLEVAPVAVLPSRPPVDEGEAWRAVLFALTDEEKWTRLLMALHEAQMGDALEVLLLSEEFGISGLLDPDASSAIFCLDWPGRDGLEPSPDLAERLAVAAPRLGALSGRSLCGLWPVDPELVPDVTGAGAGPILVLAATRDAVVPFESSRTLARALEKGILLVVEGSDHGAYQPGRADRACAVAAVDRYLVDLEVWADGSVCRSGSAGL